MDLKGIRSALICGLFCCALLSATGLATPSTDASGAVEQELIAREQSSWDLAVKKEAAAYKALHAQDFITVSADGVMNRGRSEASALDAGVSFDHYALSGLHVTWMHKSVALITYRVVVSGTDHGKKFDADAYASSIWVKRQGQWLNVFYQATPVAKK